MQSRTLCARLFRFIPATLFAAGLATLFACAPPPTEDKPTPREILRGAIEFDLEWGASAEAVVALLRDQGISFTGPKLNESRAAAFPDEPELWNSTIEVVLNNAPGFGCRPITQILFKFKPGRGLYDIERAAAELCVDPW